jgi:hypothetical protein
MDGSGGDGLTVSTGHRAGWKGERMNETPLFTERHYTVDEVAALWSLSRDSVRRMFLSEPDVPKIARPGGRYKRSYVTLRIPESVLNRVYRRMCAGRVA